MKKIKIGIDLDNTLINYSISYKILFKEYYPMIKLYKRQEIKNYLQTNSNSEFDYNWRKFQSVLYTDGLKYARLSASLICILKNLQNQLEIYLISHKTQTTDVAFGGKNLRSLSTDWLKDNKIIPYYTPINRLYYLDSQNDKINLINSLNLDIYIDDLSDIIFSKKIENKLKKIRFIYENNIFFIVYNYCVIMLNILYLLLKKND